ncbi:MAG TPA: HD domain-containing phosphohydrolase [Actinomycetes bacterium]
MPVEETPARWQRRAVWARTIRVTVFCAPVLASFGAAWAVREALPPATDLTARGLQLAVLVAVSTLVLLLVDRLGRRALPLVTLLDLSMLFPDRAPSRVKVARDAIKKRPIEEQLARVRDAGADPGAVAREILTLVAALSQHDRPTRGHAERVRMFTDLLAAQMKIPPRDRDLLRWVAILHDIGKLKVPATLLNKPGKPTEHEWELLKAHPGHGADMAEALLPWLGEWGDVIVQHHERYDGTGYPTGLSGAQISLGARIVSVADAYDVMTAARAYKRPVSRAAALAELVKFSGSQFDPMVVRAMVAVGAPRLRRAQGLVAWLADLPLVATGSVPAATVARVIGAGALATGAVTGGVVLEGALPQPPRGIVAERAVSEGAADRSRTGDRDSDGPAVESAAADRAATSLRPEKSPTPHAADASPTAAGDPATTGTGDTDAARAANDGSAPGPAGSTSTDDRSGDVAPSDTATSTAPTPAPATTGGTGKSSGGALTETVGTVTDTVDGAVGTVTGTVDDVLTDPVGTVDGVVSDPAGTVTGTLDKLLGGSKATPTPSPSPTSTSGGGLLGGLLGR